MKKDMALLKTLFISTLYISTFTFGGGYVIVPLMEKKFVSELKWFDQDEMLDMIAIGQSAPGSIAVNTSILVGYRIAGILGAAVTILGTVLPPLLIMTILSYLYTSVKDNVVINNILKGMQAGVAAVIVSVVFKMGSRIIMQKKFIPIAMMIFSIIAGIVFNLNIILILLIAAVVGFIQTMIDLKAEADKGESK